MWPTCLLVTFMGTWGCRFLPVELYSCLLCLWSQEVNRKKVVAHLYWVYEWPDMVLHMEVESYGCFPMKSGVRTKSWYSHCVHLRLPKEEFSYLSQAPHSDSQILMSHLSHSLSRSYSLPGSNQASFGRQFPPASWNCTLQNWASLLCVCLDHTKMWQKTMSDVLSMVFSIVIHKHFYHMPEVWP